MDITTILSVGTFILILIALLLAIFLLTVKSSNSLSNKLLAAFLIVLAITISVFCYGFYVQIPLVIDKLRDDIGILQTPLMYLYVLASIYEGFKMKKKHYFHLLAGFVFVTLLLIPRFYLAAPAERLTFLNQFYAYPEAQFSVLFSHFHALFYISLIYWTLAKAKKILLENYTDARLLMHKWLFQLNTVSLTLFCFATFKSLYRHQAPNEEAMHIVRIVLIFFLILFLCWMVMKALYYPELFRGIDAGIKPVADLVEEEEQTGMPAVGEAEAEKIAALLHYMKQEKPYLEPSLTLQKLARQRSMAATELSILINHKIGKHFFDFINEYRIKEAQRILVDPQQKQLTVLEILYQVGFNSKSSFNTAFKKYSGTTPTQYRRSHS